MRILVTGICGFAGSCLVRELLSRRPGLSIVGLDNFSRPGSRRNRGPLEALGISVLEGDVRRPETIAEAGAVDWVIDASANPSVLAGLPGHSASRDLLETNLVSTIHLLEHCRAHRAGFILLSTSRVYGIEPLARVRVEAAGRAYRPVPAQDWPPGLSTEGISEEFSIAPPASLYGVSKSASEMLALEYRAAFGLPVWINRCGLLAGAGQFGRPDQGIVAYWIHAWQSGRPLSYIGFGGQGHQVRDMFHPRDLAGVILEQLGAATDDARPRVANFAGGTASARSLAELSSWCSQRFGARPVSSDPATRPYDLPWIVLDCSRARRHWGWSPSLGPEEIWEEIARHAEAHPGWLEISEAISPR
jgi:CDP-paratose 2-epimerase